MTTCTRMHDRHAPTHLAPPLQENWGLNTYRETALLARADDGSSSQSELQRVAIVIAHESAHQWFGDAVTMAWWNALFLNEGFASLVEYIGTDHAQPQFEASRQFYSSTVLPALRAVSWGSARPLVSRVDSSGAIESQFDGVSYSMGASILSSTRGFMERAMPGSFFGGVGAYLRAHMYGNAEPEALWEALGECARERRGGAWRGARGCIRSLRSGARRAAFQGAARGEGVRNEVARTRGAHM